MELIDRKALIEWASKHYDGCDEVAVLHAVDAQPTAEERTAELKEIIELEVEIQDEEAEEKLTTFNVYECGHCHWRFIGDMNRYGYGYTSESTDTPNFCPNCGIKFKEV